MDEQIQGSKLDSPSGGAMTRSTSTHNLRLSERAFVTAMRQLLFGRFEFLRIEGGELVLDPWPSTVRNVKFGNSDMAAPKELPTDFELKRQVAEFFEYVREVSAGEIRTLEIRHGLPFSMEVELSGAQAGAREGGHRG